MTNTKAGGRSRQLLRRRNHRIRHLDVEEDQVQFAGANFSQRAVPRAAFALISISGSSRRDGKVAASQWLIIHHERSDFGAGEPGGHLQFSLNGTDIRTSTPAAWLLKVNSKSSPYSIRRRLRRLAMPTPGLALSQS